jgi:hypothetical protein
MASAVERNKRLDALTAAAKDWGNRRTKDLKARVASSKAILRGRTGSERLAQASVSAASALVVSEIDDFLLT